MRADATQLQFLDERFDVVTLVSIQGVAVLQVVVDQIERAIAFARTQGGLSVTLPRFILALLSAHQRFSN